MSDLTPLTPQEIYQKSLDEAQGEPLVPETRLEYFLNKIAEGGSGGGSSDFTTCTLTIGSDFNERNPLSISIPTVNEGSDFFEDSATTVSNLRAGTRTIVLYKGKMICTTLYTTITGTGDFTFEDSILTITGDCTITGAE